MGYRNYLSIIKKEDLKKIDADYIEKLKDEDGCLIITDLLERAGAVEIYELGKYSKEGAVLEQVKVELPEDLQKTYELIKQHADDHEYGFNVVTKDELIWCIKSYEKRVKDILTDYLEEKSKDEFDERSREERLMEYVRDKLTWFEYYTNLKDDDKYHVQSTWFYEYGLFDLIHVLKMVNWDEYVLIVTGW